jgi:hypothetical protein
MSNPGPASTQSVHPQQLGTNQACRLLAVQQGVSLATSGDAAVLPLINSTNYSVFQVVLTNASANISTGYLAVRTAPAAAGTAIVANAVLTALTGSTVVDQRTVATTAVQTAQNLYVNVGTPVTGTVDVYIYGYDFSVQ